MMQSVLFHILYPPHLDTPQLTLVSALLLVLLIFEVWMLVDALAYRKMPTKDRVWWVVGMFFIHPFVAMVYLLVRSRYKPVR